MTARLSLLEPLRRRALPLQLPLVITMVPVGILLHAAWIEPVVVDVVTSRSNRGDSQAIVEAVRATLALTALIAVITAAAATMLLRGALRAVIDELRGATETIARGCLDHRIGSSRRDELGALADAIDSMAERLQRLEHARRRVLACVSHELRTPLTIMQGQAFTLERGESDPHRRDRLQLIQSEAIGLARLIAELVDASSIHAGGLQLQADRHDLVELTRDRTARHSHAAASAGVTLRHVERSGRIEAMLDADRFGRVLDNLLVNAIRHAPAESTVSIRTYVQRGGARIVEVENRCEPLDADLAASIFEPFVQGAHRSGSVGLGLAIAHGIVEAHGGELSIDHRDATRGVARFSIQLPPPTPPMHRDLTGSAGTLRHRVYQVGGFAG